MKNIIKFYNFIFTPMIAMVLMVKIGLIGSVVFVILLGIYCLFYHPLISGLRLIALGKIRKDELIKAFIPGYYNFKYFPLLFFNRE
jgi:hypothetical protein